MSKKELDKNLRYFYAEARTRGGALYSRSSLLGLRNAIERYLNNPPFNRGISITKETEFHSSNKLLQSMIKLNKRENNENTKHKPPIHPVWSWNSICCLYKATFMYYATLILNVDL